MQFAAHVLVSNCAQPPIDRISTWHYGGPRSGRGDLDAALLHEQPNGHDELVATFGERIGASFGKLE